MYRRVQPHRGVAHRCCSAFDVAHLILGQRRDRLTISIITDSVKLSSRAAMAGSEMFGK